MNNDSLEVLPSDVMAGHMMPPSMIRDLHCIAQIDARTATRINEHLSALKGLAAQESVQENLETCLRDSGSNPELADSIMRTLLNLRPGELSRTIATVDRWRNSSGERLEIFSDELFASLERNLRVIVAEYLSLALILKANDLLRAVGNELDDIAYFCDMRPVFDKSRKTIEGFVTLANMRLMYRSQNNAQHTFEVALTEQELRDMVTAGTEALDKLEVLKKAAAQLSQSIKQEAQTS